MRITPEIRRGIYRIAEEILRKRGISGPDLNQFADELTRDWEIFMAAALEGADEEEAFRRAASEM